MFSVCSQVRRVFNVLCTLAHVSRIILEISLITPLTLTQSTGMGGYVIRLIRRHSRYSLHRNEHNLTRIPVRLSPQIGLLFVNLLLELLGGASRVPLGSMYYRKWKTHKKQVLSHSSVLAF